MVQTLSLSTLKIKRGWDLVYGELACLSVCSSAQMLSIYVWFNAQIIYEKQPNYICEIYIAQYKLTISFKNRPPFYGVSEDINLLGLLSSKSITVD